MDEVFVGRQPIYDRDGKTYAYELLFRARNEASARFESGDAATYEVFQNILMDIGLHRLVGDRLAFINLTRPFLMGSVTDALPTQRVVLELLEDIEIDDEVVAAVQSLRERGYVIALDDYIYHENHVPLLKLASIVKIDLKSLTPAQLREHVRQLEPYKLKLLAEKVETLEEYETCLSLGFDYFQGYYLSRPTVIHGQRMPTSRLAVVDLIKNLYLPELQTKDLEAHISRDVSLSYHLLRFTNSAFYGTSRSIESIRHAIVYLGQDAIRNWIMIMTLRSLQEGQSEHLTTALVRARMAQRLAETTSLEKVDSFFTVGLFSNLEHFLQIPMEHVLQELPLSTEVNAALLHYEGPMGEALRCAVAFESEHPSGTRRFRNLDETQIGRLYLESLAWAHDFDTAPST